MTSISDGVTTITPLLVNGYEATSDTSNIVHKIIGRSTPEYSLGGEGPRTGTLSLLFADEAEAHSAFEVLSGTSVFTLTDVDVTTIDMTFVRDGSMRLRLTETQQEWLLEVGFYEVAP